ncbi:DUF7338 family protein [Rhizobium leguminosarum]|uniref:DUF7338 family protein n=1 Tax=Rhizobium leguminosarum TaxID=384 RepID=UPI000372C4D9|nr:hypothetical protein [Rhizobium leguminosarum]
MMKATLLYIVYLPVNVALVLLAYALSPFLAAWSMNHGPVLPGRWRWFSTLNADLDGYIPQKVVGFDPAAKGLKLWWQRTRWTWRNPCSGRQSELLGVEDIAAAFTVKRDLPLPFGFYFKLWLGWNPIKRGGKYYLFMCQIGPKRRS